MIRPAFAMLLIPFLAGCVAGPDPVTVAPSPPLGPLNSVRDLIARARVQATSATEAYYLDEWDRLDGIGQSLQDTSRQLRAVPVVKDREADLHAASVRLETIAQSLRQAAVARHVNDMNAVLSKLGLEVRNMQASFGATITETPSHP